MTEPKNPKPTPLQKTAPQDLYGQRVRPNPEDELAAWLAKMVDAKANKFELRMAVAGTNGQLIEGWPVVEALDCAHLATLIYETGRTDRERLGNGQRYAVGAIGPASRSLGRHLLELEDMDQFQTGSEGAAHQMTTLSLRWGQGMGAFAANMLTSQVAAFEREREQWAREREGWTRREAMYLERIDKLEDKFRAFASQNAESLRAAWEGSSEAENRKLEIARGMEREAKVFEYIPILLKTLGQRKEDAAIRQIIGEIPVEKFGLMLQALPENQRPDVLKWYRAVKAETEKSSTDKQGLAAAGPLDGKEPKE